MCNYIVKLAKLIKSIKDTKGYQTPITWKIIFFQKVLKFNKHCNWPVHFTSTVTNSENIIIGIDVNPGYSSGCYIQSFGKIEIGDYTQIASNVGIITSNHIPENNKIHTLPKNVKIGKYCWLGMNSVILPGVILGDFTIVGAGAVVTKSFKEGYCIIAGNPAKVIKYLDPEKCIKFEYNTKYIGYTKVT